VQRQELFLDVVPEVFHQGDGLTHALLHAKPDVLGAGGYVPRLIEHLVEGTTLLAHAPGRGRRAEIGDPLVYARDVQVGECRSGIAANDRAGKLIGRLPIQIRGRDNAARVAIRIDPTNQVQVERLFRRREGVVRRVNASDVAHDVFRGL